MHTHTPLNEVAGSPFARQPSTVSPLSQQPHPKNAQHVARTTQSHTRQIVCLKPLQHSHLDEHTGAFASTRPHLRTQDQQPRWSVQLYSSHAAPHVTLAEDSSGNETPRPRHGPAPAVMFQPTACGLHHNTAGQAAATPSTAAVSLIGEPRSAHHPNKDLRAVMQGHMGRQQGRNRLTAQHRKQCSTHSKAHSCACTACDLPQGYCGIYQPNKPNSSSSPCGPSTSATATARQASAAGGGLAPRQAECITTWCGNGKPELLPPQPQLGVATARVRINGVA